MSKEEEGKRLMRNRSAQAEERLRTSNKILNMSTCIDEEKAESR